MIRHRKEPTVAERNDMLRDIELLPDALARKRADALVKKMLDTPPDPFTPKRKKRSRAK